MIRKVYEFLKNWSFLVYIVGMFVLLLAFGGGLKTTAYILTAASFLMFFLWKYKLGQSRDPVMYWSRTLLLILCSFTLLSYEISKTPNVGLNEVIGVFFGVLVFFVGYRYFRSTNRVMWYFRIMLVITILSCFFGFAIYLLYPFNRFAGPFVDLSSIGGFFPNAWVDYLILVTPYSIVMQFSRSVSSRYDRFLGAFTLMLIISSLMLSYSRAGWLSYAVVVMIVASIYLFFQKLDFNLKKIVFWGMKLGLVFVVSLGFALSMNALREYNGFETNSFYKKVTFQASEGSVSFDERAQFFDASLKLIKEEPLFGFGPYSFRYVFPRYQWEMLAFSDHPHSVLHKIAVEAGLLSLTVFFIFIAICIAILRHSLAKSYKTNWGIRVTVGASLVGLAVHNMVDYNLNFLVIVLLVAVNLSIVFGNTLPKYFSRTFKRGWQWWAAMAMIMIGVVVGGHEGYYGYYLKKARSLEGSIAQIDQKIEFYEKANSLWQNRDVPVALVSNYIIVGDYEKAITFLEESTPNYKYYAELWYFWGEVLLKLERYEEAKDRFLYAIEMDSLNDLRYYLGLYKALEGLEDEYQMTTWRFTIRMLLDKYSGKLKENAHYTVLTANPAAAIELYGKLGMEEDAARVQELYDLEMDKLLNPRKYAK